MQHTTPRWSVPLLWARCAVAAAFVLMGLGCEREGVEETTVAKGTERVPGAESEPASPSAAAPDPGQEPGRSSAAAPPSEPGGVAAGGQPWTVPAGWTLDPEPRRMRLATYVAPDADGPVEVAITRFGGQVGGVLANVNRWRGQMGLGAVDEQELESGVRRFTAPGFAGYELRLEGSTGVMLASGVYEEAADQTWFVRTTVSSAGAADRLEDEFYGVARSIAGLSAEGDG